MHYYIIPISCEMMMRVNEIFIVFSPVKMESKWVFMKKFDLEYLETYKYVFGVFSKRFVSDNA